MGRVTVLGAENGTIGTGRALAAFQTAAVGANKASNVEITRIEISQSGSTTLGMIRGDVAVRNTAGTFTTASTTPATIRPIGGDPSGLAGNTAPAGGTARSGTFSTADSGGTYTSLNFFFNFANTAGYLWQPTPLQQLWVPPSTLVVVRFLADPTTTTGWTVTVWLDES